MYPVDSRVATKTFRGKHLRNLYKKNLKIFKFYRELTKIKMINLAFNFYIRTFFVNETLFLSFSKFASKKFLFLIE